MTNEQLIWQYLKQHSQWTDEGIAGVMGNLRAESGLRPDNIEDAYEARIGYTDASCCAAVDAGKISEDEFATAGWGIGLAQWTYHTRRRALYRFAKEQGKSIADLELQCAFIIKEMASDFPGVNEILRSTTDILTASNAVLKYYENPAVQTTAVQNVRHGYSLTVYNNNHTTVVEPVEYDETVLEAILAQLRAVNATLASIIEAIKKL